MCDSVWREEKAENVVKNICFVLLETHSESLSNTSNYFLIRALSDALKLFAAALEETKQGIRWSPALVNCFVENPSGCERFLNLMKENDFDCSGAWKGFE